VEVYNDVDDSLVNLFHVLRDPALCRQLQTACEITLYARVEFDFAQEPTDDPVERARRFLVRQNMSYSGLGCGGAIQSKIQAVGRPAWYGDGKHRLNDYRFAPAPSRCPDRAG
jgi:hypothetical protein